MLRRDSTCPPGAKGVFAYSATGEFSMVITSAHISPIIALIAGVLILLMPRLLNLVVAIYLICIGLIGLGVLRYFHIA
jgi:hypothetical protein